MVNSCVLKCGTHRFGDNIGFYSIPTVHKRTDEKSRRLMQHRRSIWLKVLNLRNPPLHGRVCGRHFVSGKPASFYEVHSVDWIPSLHLPENHSSQSDVPDPKIPRYEEEQNDVHEGSPVASSSSASSATVPTLWNPLDRVPQDQDTVHQSYPNYVNEPTNSGYPLEMASAPSIDDGCRLCLNPFVESHSTIESPMLREQMEKVFNFPVEFKAGLSSSVCENCADTITEFFRYSEKVRENQEVLNAEHSNFETKSGAYRPSCMSWDTQIKTESNDSRESSPKMYSTDMPMDSQLKQEQFIAEPSVKKDVSTQTGDESNQTPKEEVPVFKEDALDTYLRHYFALTCDICDASVDNFTHLRSHFQNEHQRKNAYIKCCGIVFHEKSRLVDHLRHQTHYVCPQCKKQFKYKAALTAHQRNIHCNQQPTQHTINCNQCISHFSNEEDLNSHIDEVHKNNGKRKCTICNQLVHLALYQQHIDEVHRTKEDDTGVHKCGSCTLFFKRKSFLEAHMKRYHYGCRSCNKHFDVLLTLNKHLATAHNVGFFCHYCDKYFNSKILYELHVKVHRGDEAPQILGS